MIRKKFLFRQKQIQQQEKNKRDAEKAAAAAAAAQAQVTRNLAEQNRKEGRGGYQSDFARDKDFMGGSGSAAEMGSFAKGGIVDMLEIYD